MDYTKIKTQIDLEAISAGELFDRQNFEAIKFQAYNYIDSLDWDNALKFANQIERKISNITPNKNQDINFYNILVFWILRLRIFAFNSLSLQDRLELLHKNCVKIVLSGLDIKTHLSKALDFYGSIHPLQKEVESIVNALSTSTEVLGNDTTAFQMLNFKQTLANWIKEYLSTLSVGGTAVRAVPSSFHIVKFMDSNVYVKALSNKEKDALREILDLLNLLLDPIANVRLDEARKPQVVRTQQDVAYMASQRGDLNSLPKVESVKPAPVVLPKIEPAKPVMPKVEPKPVPPVIPKPMPKPVMPEPVKPVAPQVTKPVPPIQPIEIEIEVPPGISFGPMPVAEAKKPADLLNVKSQIADKKKEVEIEIDRKIEELRKKV